MEGGALEELTLGGNAKWARARAGGQNFGLGGEFHFSGEAGDLIRRKSADERFQDDLTFAKTGIKIVVDAFERGPALGRVCGQTTGNLRGCLGKFKFQLFECTGKDAKLVKKPGTIAEEDMVQEAVPGSGALACIAAKEFGFERLDDRECSDVAASIGKHSAERNERVREAREKFGRDGNLLAGADEMAASMESDCVIQSDAHYGVAAFPAGSDGFKNAVLFPRQSGHPIA
jgi:hypothetical protein